MNFYELLLNRGQPSGEGMTHFERLFAAKLAGGGGEIKELEGVPPLLFKANGEPLIDWIIYGNMQQTGTPTPDSPVMPQGTGNKTANLSNVSDYTNDNTDTRTYFALRILMSKNGSQTETFSSSMQGAGEKSFTFTLTTEADTMRIVHNGSQRNLFIEELTGEFSGTYTYSFDLESNDPATIGGLVLNDIMLNTGSQPLPYEPYGQYKIPISSANTTTPVYLGEVQTTRQIKKLVLTGEELWQKSNTYQGSFYSPQVLINCALQGLICTHAEYTPVINATEYIYGKCAEEGSGVNKTLDLYLGDSSWTVAEFKSYLSDQYAAGTPVTVWYVLATPQTAVVNEPLMRIGDYADTLSKTQAGVEIPTNNGSTTVDVDTTVKPSEVYIKYMG